MVTSNVDAVYDSHVGNHARFVSHDVVNFVFSVSISEIRHLRDIMRFCKSCDDWGFPASFGSHCLGVRQNGKKSKIPY